MLIYMEVCSMLILTRRPNETVVVGGNVVLTVLDIKGGQVRIGVKAPRDVTVNRGEIQERIERSEVRP